MLIGNPEINIQKIIEFIRKIYLNSGFEKGIVAVSGGIDSALSCILLCKALGPENVIPVFLPYGNQSSDDGKKLCRWAGIPEHNWQEINIKPLVDEAKKLFAVDDDKLRLGNIMARMRMVAVYDLAKKHKALVCGTENKSELLLGYFTRFGDEASDLEPIAHLYKTQVRQLSELLGIPERILKKAPSAELWDGQTDENDFGFSYEQADLILEKYVDECVEADKIELDNISKEVVEKVINRVRSQKFKSEVPYTL